MLGPKACKTNIAITGRDKRQVEVKAHHRAENMMSSLADSLQAYLKISWPLLVLVISCVC
jgi:hypothetical protein